MSILILFSDSLTCRLQAYARKLKFTPTARSLAIFHLREKADTIAGMVKIAIILKFTARYS